MLAEIVLDADRLLELARQAQGGLPEDSAGRRGIVAAAELLGQLLLQDVERRGDGVSKDRSPDAAGARPGDAPRSQGSGGSGHG